MEGQGYTDKELEEKFKEIDERFKAGDNRMSNIEKSLEDNNRSTEETKNIAKTIHDKLFVGDGDAKSLTTKVEVQAAQQTWLWGAFVFIIMSIAGLYFSSVKQEKPQEQQKQFIIMPTQPTDRRRNVEED